MKRRMMLISVVVAVVTALSASPAVAQTLPGSFSSLNPTTLTNTVLGGLSPVIPSTSGTLPSGFSQLNPNTLTGTVLGGFGGLGGSSGLDD